MRLPVGRPRRLSSRPPVRAAGRALVSGALALGAIGAAARATAEAGSVTTGASFLDTALDRAASLPEGTYVVSDGSFEPAPAAIPLLLQADADRGAQLAARVTVAVGGDVPDGTDVAVRIVTSGDAPRVVSTATASAQSGRMRLVRQFDLAPGTYDVRAAAGRSRPGGGGVASIATRRLVVPDLGRGHLVLTPLVLGDAASAAGRGPGGRPFVFGPTALSPATTSRFERGKDLNVAFRVFNWSADTAKKPDLTAEYTFYQKTGERLVFFNRTKPQHLGADTLGETFDPAAGVVTAGMSVPLEPFPLGDFQLAVRVTDKALGRSEEQRVGFSVVP